jgi:hypothetical protein
MIKQKELSRQSARALERRVLTDCIGSGLGSEREREGCHVHGRGLTLEHSRKAGTVVNLIDG